MALLSSAWGSPQRFCLSCSELLCFSLFSYLFAHFIDNNLEPLDFIADGAHQHGPARCHVKMTNFGHLLIEQCNLGLSKQEKYNILLLST
jgi:hypothetical protein